jgi:type 1 fimbriae regulatory protein FimE
MTDIGPSTANRTLPLRQPNTAYRQREYLTEKEVDRLIEAARKRGRNGPRDAAAILLAYRHRLRTQELCQLRWSQIDLRHGRLHVNRAKGGIESVHPLHGPELRALRPLQGNSPYVFVTEAGSPVTTSWFLRVIQRTGEAAKLPFPVHPHMLRHSTRYKLANDGHDTRSLAHYLGHRNPQSTARYTALAEGRFAQFWKRLIREYSGPASARLISGAGPFTTTGLRTRRTQQREHPVVATASLPLLLVRVQRLNTITNYFRAH